MTINIQEKIQEQLLLLLDCDNAAGVRIVQEKISTLINVYASGALGGRDVFSLGNDESAL